jgi:hypothetical protein
MTKRNEWEDLKVSENYQINYETFIIRNKNTGKICKINECKQTQVYNSEGTGNQDNKLINKGYVDEKVGEIEKPILSGEGANSISIGISAASSGENSIAIGAEAQANETNSIAIGTMAIAYNAEGIAIGYNANSEGNSIAIGHNIVAVNGNENSSIEQAIDVFGENNIAIGSDIQINGDNNIIIGNLNHTNITLGPLNISFALNEIIFTKGSVSATLNLT